MGKGAGSEGRRFLAPVLGVPTTTDRTAIKIVAILFHVLKYTAKDQSGLLLIILEIASSTEWFGLLVRPTCHIHARRRRPGSLRSCGGRRFPNGDFFWGVDLSLAPIGDRTRARTALDGGRT
jgi:hypothetical protein